MAGEGSWRLGAFHFCCLVLHELLQEMMFSKTKLSLARWHQVIPANSPIGGGEAQNMRVHEQPSSAVRPHNFLGLCLEVLLGAGSGQESTSRLRFWAGSTPQPKDMLMPPGSPHVCTPFPWKSFPTWPGFCRVLCVEIFIWGREGHSSGRVRTVFRLYFLSCGLVLPTLFLSQQKKADV